MLKTKKNQFLYRKIMPLPISANVLVNYEICKQRTQILGTRISSLADNYFHNEVQRSDKFHVYQCQAQRFDLPLTPKV